MIRKVCSWIWESFLFNICDNNKKFMFKSEYILYLFYVRMCSSVLNNIKAKANFKSWKKNSNVFQCLESEFGCKNRNTGL